MTQGGPCGCATASAPGGGMPPRCGPVTSSSPSGARRRARPRHRPSGRDFGVGPGPGQERSVAFNAQPSRSCTCPRPSSRSAPTTSSTSATSVCSRRAAELGDRLVVGVSADALNVSKKGRAPVFSQDERMEIVAAWRSSTRSSSRRVWTSSATTSSSTAPTSSPWATTGRGASTSSVDICEVVYFPRTPSVSTTEVIEHIASGAVSP